MFLLFSYFSFIHSTNYRDKAEETGVVNFSNRAVPGVQTSRVSSDSPDSNHSAPYFISFLRCTELFAKNIDTVLQENVILRKRIEEFEEKLASAKERKEDYSTTVTVAEKKHTYSLQSSAPSRSLFLADQSQKNLIDARYAITPEEKRKIDDIYSALPEINPKYISRVLGSRSQSSGSTFKAVQGYVTAKGENLIEYKKLYAKMMRFTMKR